MDLWVAKYRPNTIDEYVFKDVTLKEQVLAWVENGYLPGHLLLAGVQGAGKTSLALMLLKEFNVPKGNILTINGSQEGRKIEMVRNQLEGFCSTFSLSDSYKYVLIDEADYLNPVSVQPSLRNLMERYEESVRFILTCNYPAKIIAPLHSRLQTVTFTTVDKTDFMTKLAEILIAEEINFDPDLLQSYVDLNYPDLRKAINLLQQNSITGTLTPAKSEDGAVKDYLLDALNLIGQGQITKARILVCSEAREEEYPDIYRHFYQNINKLSSNVDIQNEILIILSRYLHRDAMVADREINLAAMIVEIGNLLK